MIREGTFCPYSLWLKSIVAFGLALTFCSALFGITVGAIQGYYGGWVDLLGQRLVEVWNGLPMLL